MIFETGKVVIAGFTFEKIDEIRTIRSVFIIDANDGNCIEVPIVNDDGISKEKLEKELMEYYRKEVVAIIDIKNDINRPNSRYVDLGFVGVKSNKGI